MYSYDAFGRIVQQQHIRPTVTDTYTTTYDAQGRVTQETTPTGTIQYQYDLLGRKTQCRTVVSTVPTDILSEITYTYDLFGRLSTVNTVRRDGALVDSNGAAPGTPPESTAYFYDLLGRPDYTQLPNGVIEDYTFDAMDRMDLMAHRRASDNAVLASYDYTYRADGKRTGLNESFSTTTARSNSYTWSYDNAGRLISEVLDSSDNSVDQTESYVYDLVGNRMRKEVNKPATAFVDQVFAYNYDANDRLTSETLDNGINGAGIDQTTTYGWTQTQQTSKSVQIPSTSTVTQAMSYGLGGQLERVITTTQNGSGTVTARTQVEYRYDTQGIRFIAIDSTDSNLSTTGIERIENGRTEYLIDRANFTGYQQTILETVTNAAGQATKRTTYTFGVDEITQTVSNLNASTGAVVSTETLAFAHDGKGSVRALFGAGAAIAQVFTYSAYGELLEIHNGSGTLQPLTSSLTSVLYNGEGLDARTCLYNMRARWYSASNARWERLDPFNGNPSDPFSFNKYGFVHGDPVQGIDPTGMFFSVGGFLGSFSLSAATAGAVFGAVSGAATGALDAYLGNESVIEGALWGGGIGGALGFVTGGFSAAIGTFVQGLSAAQKLIAFRSMYFLSLAGAGYGMATAKNGWQGAFRGSLGLLGALFTASAARQAFKAMPTWTIASYSSRLSRSSLTQYAEAFEALGQRLDEAYGTAAAFLRSTVRQNGRHIVGEDDILKFLYGKVVPGKKAPEALLEAVDGYRGIEVKNQINPDVGHAMQKFESVASALKEKGLAAEGFDLVVSKSKFAGFSDRNYAIGAGSSLTYLGRNVVINGAPVTVLVVDLPG
ncbi:MAG: RHS repeat domain-containing protein [Planctomycetota bacterium]